MKKMLVVYYSWSNGNTKRIAEQLALQQTPISQELIRNSHTPVVMRK